MGLSGLGSLFAILYDDRMDIYRTAENDNEDSTTDISYLLKPLYENVKCRISFDSHDTGADSDVDRNPVVFAPKIFCAQTVDLKAGDYVVVRRYADNGSVACTYEGRTTKPSWYSTHQEAFIRIDEGA